MADFSTDGIILIFLFCFLYIFVVLMRKLQEKLRVSRAADNANHPEIPEIFIISDNSSLPRQYEKLEGNPKHSYENLAPPTYEEVDTPRASGSYELPPGYALVNN